MVLLHGAWGVRKVTTACGWYDGWIGAMWLDKLAANQKEVITLIMA
jgi:hypothetical protein